jgi:dephospho-CoA kinase
MRRSLYKVGVTGGIASGKSTLLKYLSKQPRIYTLNLDLIGIDIYQLNPKVLRDVRQIFGKEAVNVN